MNDASIAPGTREFQIRLFGGFRQFRPESMLALELDDASTVADLRKHIARVFDDDANALSLLKASAFATDTRVLDEDETVPADADLALLPPVCGG